MELSHIKSCAIIPAFMLRVVAVCHAHEVVPLCGAAGAVVAVTVSPVSLNAQFRCGAGFSILEPPLHAGNVYGDHGCINSVKLSSRLPGAQLTRTSKVHNLYTFSVLALPTAKSQLLYYMCISSDRKLACKVVINVPVASAVKRRAGAGNSSAETQVPVCWEPGKTLALYMPKTTRRVFFRCSPELSELDPPAAAGTVYTNRSGSLAVPLVSLSPGVLVNLAPAHAFYVLALHTLPTATFVSYFYRCVSPVTRRQACTVNIVVPPKQQSLWATRALIAAASIRQTQGGGRSPGNQREEASERTVRTCTVQKKAIVSPLSPQSLSAQFTCAAGLSLVDPPALSGNVYLNKRCSQTIRLQSLWNASLHISSGFLPVYTVRVKMLPADRSHALFYRCTSPQTGEACLVEIKIPRGSHVATGRPVVEDSPRIPICSNVGGSVEVDVDTDTQAAKFRCGGRFVALHPSVMSGKAYITRSCNVPVSVQGHLGGDITLAETNKNFFAVSLPRLPEEEPKRLYFLCKQPSEEGACKVILNVPQKVRPRPKGFQTDIRKLHICRGGPDAAVRMTLHAYDSFRLKCAPGLTIHPHNLQEIFDNSDGSCSALSTLHDLLPGAQMLSASSSASDPRLQSGLVFLVNEPPQRDKELCYYCAPAAHTKAHDCKILISVTGKATARKTDTDDKMVAHQSSANRTSAGANMSAVLSVIMTLAGVAKAIAFWL